MNKEYNIEEKDIYLFMETIKTKAELNCSLENGNVHLSWTGQRSAILLIIANILNSIAHEIEEKDEYPFKDEVSSLHNNSDTIIDLKALPYRYSTIETFFEIIRRNCNMLLALDNAEKLIKGKSNEECKVLLKAMHMKLNEPDLFDEILKNLNKK